MSHIRVGVWVRRPLGNVTKWHLCESIVDEDAITRCGRRMDRENANGELEVSEVMPLTRAIGQPQLCKAGCDRPGMVVFNNEDDGSTVNEIVP